MNSVTLFILFSCTVSTNDIPYSANVNQEVVKEFPHVVGGVDLLHFNLRIHIAVVQEVDISNLHLDVIVEHNKVILVVKSVGLKTPRFSPNQSVADFITAHCE